MAKKVDFILRLIAAIILLQTLFFKFTGAPESVYIFSTLGVEPIGRYFAGASELVASILILIPQTAVLGALAGIGIMFGAIVSHFFVLGIEVQGDGGLLFALACIVTICCAIVAFKRKDELQPLIQKIFKR